MTWRTERYPVRRRDSMGNIQQSKENRHRKFRYFSFNDGICRDLHNIMRRVVHRSPWPPPCCQWWRSQRRRKVPVRKWPGFLESKINVSISDRWCVVKKDVSATKCLKLKFTEYAEKRVCRQNLFRNQMVPFVDNEFRSKFCRSFLKLAHF